MPYMTCPQCHASFHVGVLYVEHDSCPRCGARVAFDRAGWRGQFTNGLLRRHRPQETLDWEAITSSQYELREYVSRVDRGA
jgi:Zn-finger nucleic acid-binding protein